MAQHEVVEEFLDLERYYRAVFERAKMRFRHRQTESTEEALRESLKDYLNLLVTVWEHGGCPSEFHITVQEGRPSCDSLHSYADYRSRVIIENDVDDALVMSGVVKEGYFRRLEEVSADTMTELLRTASDMLFQFEKRHEISVSYPRP